MPDNQKLTHALDARFFAPLRRPRTRRIGIELELPIWNKTPGAATDFDAVHAAIEEFLSRFNFPDTAFDDMGALYRASDAETGDELSFDCSFNTLEISFGPDENLTTAYRRFHAYYDALQEAFERRGHALTSPAREHLARLERGESIESIALDYGSAEEERHA